VTTSAKRAVVTRADIAIAVGVTYDAIRKSERTTGLYACRVKMHRGVLYSTQRVRALPWWRQIFPDGDPL